MPPNAKPETGRISTVFFRVEEWRESLAVRSGPLLPFPREEADHAMQFQTVNVGRLSPVYRFWIWNQFIESFRGVVESRRSVGSEITSFDFCCPCIDVSETTR